MRITACLLLLAFPLTAAAQDGGIEIFAGETIFKEGTRVSLTEVWKTQQGLFRGNSSVFDSLDQRFVERRTVLGVNHGIARNWSLSALMPFVERSLDKNDGDLSSSGLGDLALIVKHRFMQRNWYRSAWHSAWIVGVETPTGSTSEHDGGMRLLPGLQPGSGSWDPFIGIASTISLDLWRFDAVALYKENTEGAQNFEEGDKLTLSLTGKYRFLLEVYPGPSASATIGLKWSTTSNARSEGLTAANSGGEELVFRMKLGCHPRPDIDLGLAIDLPLHQDLNGQQLGLDSRVQISLGWRF